MLKRRGAWIDRPTEGKAVAERTAAVIWSVLEQIDASVFRWNVFPRHPHDSSGAAFTNRAHNDRQRRSGEELLCQIIILLKPRKLVPIGNDAASTAYWMRGKQDLRAEFGTRSYGGQNDFLRQTRELYGWRRADSLV